MPAVLTHKSIMLLARERLAEIRQTIRLRQRAGVRVTTLDRRIADLADRAYRIMSTPPFPDTDLPGQAFARPLGERVSKFAVMGSMGPDITAFSGLLAPGQGWVFDTVHKAYPDEHREAVNAQTCDFIFEFWRQARAALLARFPDAADRAKRDKLLDNMRAYVLGHLCHIAADVVSHPFINDLEFHQGHSGHKKLHHADGEGSHDAMVARRVLLRASTRDGQAWDGWWPTLDEVPKEFYAAYDGALEEIYRARTKRRTGFGQFEELFKALEPPAASADFVKDGYRTYRGAILSVGYGYGWGSWFGMLTPLMLAAMALPVLAAALPQARRDFSGAPPPAGDPEAESRRATELVTLPIVLGGPVTLFYGIWLATLSTRGVGARTGLGLAHAALTTLLAVSFFATSFKKPMPGWWRWAVEFGVPTAASAAFLIAGLVDTGREKRGARGGLTLVYGLPLVLLVLGVVCWAIFRITKAAENDAGIDTAAFWITAAIWFVLILVAWIVIPFYLRDARIPEKPGDFTAVKTHHVRLFDDATLFVDPKVTPEGLPDRFFPSGRRKLLKLWWEGDDDLYIRVDRFQLAFSSEDKENAGTRFVPAPVGPMKVSEYIAFLGNAVTEGGATGKLKAAFFHPEDPDCELPSGAAFADHGDEDEELSEEKHAAAAARFRKLGKTQDDPYTLWHGHKKAQAIRFGRRGPVAKPFHLTEAEIRAEEDETGYAYVHDVLDGPDTETLMSYAGDVAALLCLGAVEHVADAPAGDKVYQVFRNWSLDRRRVNEWRMLVAGDAFSEKAGHPEAYDRAMLDGFGPADKAAWTAPLHAAGPGILAQGERTALKMGWVKLLRAWLDVMRRPAQDPLAATSFRPENPANVELGRGLAYLLDMADPV